MVGGVENMYSVLNYIGKKEVNLLEDMMVLDMKVYCEPFSGSYNTGFKLIDTGYKAKYILNDLDENVYNYLNYIIHRLKKKHNPYLKCHQRKNQR